MPHRTARLHKMDTVPAYVDWRACMATSAERAEMTKGSSKTPNPGPSAVDWHKAAATLHRPHWSEPKKQKGKAATGGLALPFHQKPNSWTYNFVEVSGYNLESSQSWGFCMDFLQHWEAGMIFCQVLLFSFFTMYSNWTVLTVRGCVSLKKYNSQVKAVEVTFVWISSKNSPSEEYTVTFLVMVRGGTSLLLCPSKICRQGN